MAGAPGPLHEAGNALGRTDLQYSLHGQEVYSQVQAGGADHCLQPALLEAALHPVTGIAGQRGMVQGNQSGPVGACFEQGLVPEFGLRPSVGEYQATAAGVDFPTDLVEHLQAHVPSPGEALDGRWQQGIDL